MDWEELIRLQVEQVARRGICRGEYMGEAGRRILLACVEAMTSAGVERVLWVAFFYGLCVSMTPP